MPPRKPLRSSTRRSQPPPASPPRALTAARRALDRQTARVTELEEQIRLLTIPLQKVTEARVALTDTDIYWRRRLLR